MANSNIFSSMIKQILNIAKITFLAILLTINTISAKAQEWNIDKNHSSVSFEITHFFTPVKGNFRDFTGELSFDPDNLANSSASFTVKISSVDTDNDKRDSDLESGNFFEAGKFPEMNFKSSQFMVGDAGYLIIGSLTIKNVTKEVEIPFKVLGIGMHPSKKGRQIMGIKAEFSINRNDYGVGTGNWTATAVVGDEVQITVILEANRNI